GYMLSGEVSESASSSSTTYYGSCSRMDPDVAERITSLLSSLRLTSLHNNIPQNGEVERLKQIHRQLEWLVSEESRDWTDAENFSVHQTICTELLKMHKQDETLINRKVIKYKGSITVSKE
ncbi:hypothetical protein WUBG_16604, partial [Wuchereria bancrofti]